MSDRTGRSSIGCLLVLLIIVAAVYFGVNIGEAYLRFYRFQDGMQQAVRFAAHTSDAAILRDLRALSDSIGLPEGARNVTVRRRNGFISVSGDYYEQVELPLFVREIHFEPHAEGAL